MRIISILVFGMVGVFVTQIESKDFCESYAENGYEIDLNFVLAQWLRGEVFDLNLYFVIKTKWWLLFFGSNELLNIVGNSSEFNIGYPLNPYISSFATLLPNDTTIYGFIKKKDYTIDWKRMSGEGSFYLVKTVASPFDSDGFEPSISFYSGLYDIKHDVGKNTREFRLTFIDQKKIEDSDGELFERTYTSLRFKNGTGNIVKKNDTEWIVANKTIGRNRIIGLVGPVDLSIGTIFIVLYKIENTIEYCFQKVNTLNISMDEPCITGRKVLITCTRIKPKSNPNHAIWVVIIVGIICVVTIVVFAICLWFNRHRFTGPGLSGSHPPSSGLSSFTIGTINSDTGLPIRSKNVSNYEKNNSKKTPIKDGKPISPSKLSTKTKPKAGLSPTKAQSKKKSPKEKLNKK